MKRLLLVILFLFAAGGVGAYAYRGDLRDWWYAKNAPVLPEARPFTPAVSNQSATSKTNVEEPSIVEGGVATSQHFMIVSSTPAKPEPKPQAAPSADPFTRVDALPAEANLAVPFTSQAPLADWNLPYQEACEEASSIMVDAYYRGEKGKIDPQVAKKRIDDLVAFENKTIGFYKDTTAEQTAQFIRDYFGYKNVVVRPLSSVNDIKTVVANGYPVMIPADGKLLGNPNFRNGGPPYHMLVVKGYTTDKFITNDPGTRLGADYTYAFDVIMKAAHDWGGTSANGSPKMIVILPN